MGETKCSTMKFRTVYKSKGFGKPILSRSDTNKSLGQEFFCARNAVTEGELTPLRISVHPFALYYNGVLDSRWSTNEGAVRMNAERFNGLGKVVREDFMGHASILKGD